MDWLINFPISSGLFAWLFGYPAYKISAQKASSELSTSSEFPSLHVYSLKRKCFISLMEIQLFTGYFCWLGLLRQFLNLGTNDIWGQIILCCKQPALALSDVWKHPWSLSLDWTVPPSALWQHKMSPVTDKSNHQNHPWLRCTLL